MHKGLSADSQQISKQESKLTFGAVLDPTDLHNEQDQLSKLTPPSSPQQAVSIEDQINEESATLTLPRLQMRIEVTFCDRGDWI